jgi:hypothetical protein
MIGKSVYNPLATIGGVILFKSSYVDPGNAVYIDSVYQNIVTALRSGHACVIKPTTIERITDDRDLKSLANNSKVYGGKPREIVKLSAEFNVNQYKTLISEVENDIVGVAYILTNGDIRMAKSDTELTILPFRCIAATAGVTAGKFGEDAAKNFELIINHSNDIERMYDLSLNVSIFELMGYMPEMLRLQAILLQHDDHITFRTLNEDGNFVEITSAGQIEFKPTTWARITDNSDPADFSYETRDDAGLYTYCEINASVPLPKCKFRVKIVQSSIVTRVSNWINIE